MPFEGTDLCIGDLAADGSCSNPRRIAGSATESIFQPEWSDRGDLYFVSDRSGWSNLYVERDGEVHPLTEEQAELGYPQWVFDLSRYAFLADGRIACVFTRDAVDGLELLDVSAGRLSPVDLPYTAFQSPSLQSHGAKLYFPATSAKEPTSTTAGARATGASTATVCAASGASSTWRTVRRRHGISRSVVTSTRPVWRSPAGAPAATRRCSRWPSATSSRRGRRSSASPISS